MNDVVTFDPGDKVQIMVGGPHENFLRIATVDHVQSGGPNHGDLVVYFDDQDEDQWVYSPGEVRKIRSANG